MTISEFANHLCEAIIAACKAFRRKHSKETPYAFALVGCDEYLCYAVATEEGLKRTANCYHRLGYRYQGWDWERFNNRKKLATWLRWDNPDTGWHYGEFPRRFKIRRILKELVEVNAFGVDGEDLEEFYTECACYFAAAATLA